DYGFELSTINGFVHGAFHGQPVKAGVYEPGWETPERARFTMSLARIAAALCAESTEISISSVPLGVREPAGEGASERAQRRRDGADALRRTAEQLERLEAQTGVRVSVAIEPEPACLLETGAEALEFIERELLEGTDGSRERRARHLGLCLDACHAAVAFEDPLALVDEARRRAVPIHKLQISSALVLPRADAGGRAALAEFRDEVYLHQV